MDPSAGLENLEKNISCSAGNPTAIIRSPSP